MMNTRTKTVIWIGSFCVVACACGSRAVAQLSPAGAGLSGVAGSGSAVVEQRPDRLRVQLLISADGKDAKEAVAKLKAKEDAAKAKLRTLGAAEESVVFSDPQPQDAGQRQQMEQMLQMRMNGRVQKQTKAQAPAMTVTTTLKAEWPLTAQDGDALLIESQELESKIKAADLAGSTGARSDKPADKTAALEADEAAEEAQAMSNGQPNPRDPVFLFVAKISEADRDKARAEAFQKARAEATKLAKLAGNELGPNIRLLVSNVTPNIPNDPFSQMFDNGFQQRFLYNMMNRPDGGVDDAGEAIGTQPGKVGYRITVYVAFEPK